MNKQHKCYIAGKIGGLSIAEYTQNFNIAKEEVLNMGYNPISPTDLPHNHDKTWSSYMREDVTEMLKCDAVYCLSNWRNSPGATIEINIALQIGLTIIHQPKKAQ